MRQGGVEIESGLGTSLVASRPGLESQHATSLLFDLGHISASRLHICKGSGGRTLNKGYLRSLSALTFQKLFLSSLSSLAWLTLCLLKFLPILSPNASLPGSLLWFLVLRWKSVSLSYDTLFHFCTWHLCSLLSPFNGLGKPLVKLWITPQNLPTSQTVWAKLLQLQWFCSHRCISQGLAGNKWHFTKMWVGYRKPQGIVEPWGYRLLDL